MNHTPAGADLAVDRRYGTQLAAWLTCGVLYFLAVKPLMGLPTLPLLVFKLGWAVSGFVITVAMSRLYGSGRVAQLKPTAIVALAGLTSLVAAIAWLAAFRQIAIGVFGSTTVLFSASGIPFVFLNHFFLLLAWSGTHFAVVSWRKVRAQERQLADAALAAKEAHLEMLRYQVNPHFLFNVLTTIRGLVGSEPLVARQMITELGTFLRATLDGDIASVTSLEAELEIVERYLRIERIRFEDRLDAVTTCDPAARDVPVPSFILHPLVENAIRHGTPNDRGGIVVRIAGRATDDGAELEVANPGTLQRNGDNGSGHSIGLRNVSARLSALDPDGTRFEINERDGWVRARILVRRPLAAELR